MWNLSSACASCSVYLIADLMAHGRKAVHSEETGQHGVKKIHCSNFSEWFKELKHRAHRRSHRFVKCRRMY
jgi:hypothetical protein